MISIEKINETWLRVSSDPGIEQELVQFFTFDVPGYKFMPAYKAGHFDGKIRLYNAGRKTLYAGLLHYVRFFAERNEYQLEYINTVESSTQIDYATVQGFTDSLKLHSGGKPIEPRDYQIAAITHAIQSERSLLISPTASGKSLIIYSLLRYHIAHGRKCILVVPNVSLVEQMVADFADYSSFNRWPVVKRCQKLYSGFPKEFSADVLVTTYQSITKQPQSWFDQFDVVIGDEAHTFKSKSLTGIMEKLVNTRYRTGTTGTIDSSKVNKLVLEGVFGPLHKVISTRELMDNGSVAQLKIKCLIMKYDEITRKIQNKAPYQREIDFIVGHDARNQFIANLAVGCTGNTLVLFQYVERHGVPLYELIKSKVGDSRKVFFIHGGVDVEVRESARHLTAQESDAIIVASYGTMSTGTNVPSIENVIFASPSKSKIRNLQSIGRGLRLKSGKSHCNLFDISDDLHWKSWKNHTLNHLQERVKIYAEEKFNYKMLEINLE